MVLPFKHLTDNLESSNVTFLIPPDLILVTTFVGATEDANLNGNEAWFRDRMVSWELGDKFKTRKKNIYDVSLILIS
jgi:hypothetical protein